MFGTLVVQLPSDYSGGQLVSQARPLRVKVWLARLEGNWLSDTVARRRYSTLAESKAAQISTTRPSKPIVSMN